MPSVFTRIVQGEIPAYKVSEDKYHLAFLDISPIKKGHVLVIPKKETDKIFDLSPTEFVALMSFSYRVAKALEKVIPAQRVGMAVLGFEVSHAHIHLVPMDQESDLDFSHPKISVSVEEFKQLASAIQGACGV